MSISSETFQVFQLEHYQSLYEHSVEINLADSSVRCLSLGEWLTSAERESLLETSLAYPQVNGTDRLRLAIAAMYKGAESSNVFVTVGASEANALICFTLLRPGVEIVVTSPTYAQVSGIAKNLGCRVRELRLRAESDWRPDLDELDSLVTPRTALVSIVNPNNPTGVSLTDAEMNRIVASCTRVGAWLHADEVYLGTDRTESATCAESFWGSYDRLLCTGSLSKAYGLAGLRIGWVLTTPEMIESLWRRHEYGVITAAGPSMTLATIALSENKRHELLQRQRRLTGSGLAVLDEWLTTQFGRFDVRPAAATSIAWLRHNLPLSSFELAEHIRRTASVLVAPGSFLGSDQHIRLTVGYEPNKIREALGRIAVAVSQLQ